MGAYRLDTAQRQEPRLNPLLLQRVELLQMGLQEVAAYAERAILENPVLEPAPPAELEREFAELRGRAAWLSDGAVPVRVSPDALPPEPGAADPRLEGAQAFLFDQLERLRLSEPLLLLCKYLVELLDEDGYLERGDAEGLAELRVQPVLGEEALAILRGLEPPGVGAFDLRDCLLLQLERATPPSPLAAALVRDHLDELGQGRDAALRRSLNVTEAELAEARAAIAALEPRPLAAFQTARQPLLARPDVFVVENADGEPQPVLNRYHVPRLRISAYYESLSRSTDDKELETYLRAKLRDARALLTGLEQRNQTLLRCAERIVGTQRAFFTGETKELLPLRLTELSGELGLNVSTVSRAVAGKYLQCRFGVYPLRWFFSRPLSGGGSRQAAKLRLLALVGGESGRAPLSDRQLAERLARDGVPVSRRTVAKYRAELNIPPAHRRRTERG